ncbi:MAG TPA: MazG family protein, partial [Gammaproteobacteria bacterium]|nr:MazG family protein [Gammaproteobacteria bacterium]
VFAGETIVSAEAQTHAWERHKAMERGAQESLLDGVPLALPALTRAEKLQRRASRAGFDWPTIHGVSDKVEEELEELCREIATGTDRDALVEEAGDLLFAAVNLLRHAGVDPESALRRGNAKFTRRFRGVEAMCAEAGRAVADTDLDTLDAYWDTVKELEGNR